MKEENSFRQQQRSYKYDEGKKVSK